MRSPPAGQATLDDVFSVEVVLELGEDAADSIAEIGALVERANGGFLIADRLLPRVRSYAEDGRLEAAFGRFGEGPFEFRRIDGVAEGPSGSVVVVDRRLQGLTYLTQDLQPDRLVSLPGVPYNVLSMNADLLLHMEIPTATRAFLGC